MKNDPQRQQSVSDTASLEVVSQEVRDRTAKLDAIRHAGLHPYPERYHWTHTPFQASVLEDGVSNVSVAGRLTRFRSFGNLAFGVLYDANGTVQIALKADDLGKESMKMFESFVDTGDHVGVVGKMFTTNKGQKTLNVREWTLLSKALRPLPEKFHGLADKEQRLRKRYLDIISDERVRNRFLSRTKIVRSIRRFLDANDFMEIETPILVNKSSGALARPFTTHHNANDFDVYLRVAPETSLKKAVAAGFPRVYEYAKSFRNEGMDPSHLPEFTMLEWYASYWNFEDNMRFTQLLVQQVVKEVTGGHTIEHQGHSISFAGDAWPRISFRELLLKDADIDIDQHTTRDALLAAIREKGIEIEESIDDTTSYGTLIDVLYKKVSRPKLVDPVFVTSHPIDISPLARKNDKNPRNTDRFQLVVRGWEIVNAYSELIDPIDQRQRFKAQMAAREAGDEETMELDEEYLLAMEHGMPPMSGWGMGIDRFVALLTDAESLRETVLFPLMKPQQD